MLHRNIFIDYAALTSHRDPIFGMYVCIYEWLAQFVVSTIVPGSFISHESFLHPGWGDWDFFIKKETKQNKNIKQDG